MFQACVLPENLQNKDIVCHTLAFNIHDFISFFFIYYFICDTTDYVIYIPSFTSTVQSMQGLPKSLLPHCFEYLIEKVNNNYINIDNEVTDLF